MNSKVYMIILSIFIFTGCDVAKSNSIEDIKKMCKEQGKKFKIEKRFNYREGKHEQMGLCY